MTRKLVLTPAQDEEEPLGFKYSLVPLSSLISDPANARKHSEENINLIAEALQEVGAARSIVINDEDQILAGNGTVEACSQVGIHNVLVIDTDGSTLVAVRRSGLTELEQTRLALYDNAAGDKSEWDTDRLVQLAAREDAPFLGIIDGDFLSALSAASDMQGDEEPAQKQSRAKRLAFRLDFDNAEQLARFERFRTWLKKEYGDAHSEAYRIDQFLTENVPGLDKK